ncbi:MAG: hypothetical protein K2Y27_35100 [Xanthobacteraceae bacterium]|nr:hypothetical protein [Xanthobacteraceae bacterium]
METFKVAAVDMGLATSSVDVVMGNLPSWTERREVCLRMSNKCLGDFGKPEFAAAWSALGADPAEPGWRKPGEGRVYEVIFVAIAKAIVADATLLDDDLFCAAVNGWKFLEQAGSDGEQDLIVSARKYGATVTASREEILAWARSEVMS